MPDINNIKFEPHLNLPKIQFGKKSNDNKKGGQGAEVFIFSRNITGSGEIITDGGDGDEGGDAGVVRMISESNHFLGKISAKGGKSYRK